MLFSLATAMLLAGANCASAQSLPDSDFVKQVHHAKEQIKIESEDELVPIGQYVKECSVIQAPRSLVGPERDDWLQQFKPCGWYKANCEQLADVQVLEANVVYPPNQDFLGTGLLEDLQPDMNYIVQFDVGIHPSGPATNDETYSRYFQDGGVWPLEGGIDLDDPNYSAGEGYVLGETCLETHAQAGPDGYGDWGDLHGSNYGCMGKCGGGCMGAGYARDCMKHDVCSAFKTVAQGQAAEGFCMDVDCGDEAMQSTTHCRVPIPEIPGSAFPLPEGLTIGVTCRESDFENSTEYTVDAELTIAAELWNVVRPDQAEAACFLWTGWEKGQGAPNALRAIGEGCPWSSFCASARCDYESYFSFNKICMERLDSGQPCNEDTDCKSSNCPNGIIRRCAD